MLARHEYVGSQCGQKFELLAGYPKDTVACLRCQNLECVGELSFDWGKTSAFSHAGEQSFGIRYYKNPQTGHIIVAGTHLSKPPAGYRVETTTSYREVQNLEKQINNQEKSFSSRKREQLAIADEWDRKQLRANLSSEREIEILAKDQMEARYRQVAEYAEETGARNLREYKPTIEDPASRARLAAEVSRAYADQVDKNASTFQSIDPEVHFDTMHNDSSKAVN